MDDTYPRLVGDIGGTHARFALQASPSATLDHIVGLQCSDHCSLVEAIQHYLKDVGERRPRWACLGVATPVLGDRVQMTNNPWAFSISELRDAVDLAQLKVLNDFTALALSLPVLPARELVQHGGGEPVPGTPLAVLGAGTGLGVSG